MFPNPPGGLDFLDRYLSSNFTIEDGTPNTRYWLRGGTAFTITLPGVVRENSTFAFILESDSNVVFASPTYNIRTDVEVSPVASTTFSPTEFVESGATATGETAVDAGLGAAPARYTGDYLTIRGLSGLWVMKRLNRLNVVTRDFFALNGTIRYAVVTGTADIAELVSDANGNVQHGTDALDALTTGSNNTGVGTNAGAAVTTGSGNSLYGYNAGAALTTGSENVLIGLNAGYGLTTLSGNVALGARAGAGWDAPLQCTAIGFESQENGSVAGGGDDNTSVGYRSLRRWDAGYRNCALGSLCMHAVPASNGLYSDNAFFGYSAGANGAPIQLCGFGSNALRYATGAENTGLGYYAGAALTTGANNTAAGWRALYQSTVGARNTCFGDDVMSAATTSAAFADNSSFGYRALKAITSGSGNSAFGSTALDALTTGVDCAAFGYGALGANVSGNENSAFGKNALSAYLGSECTAGGFNALRLLTTGTHATAFGWNALAANTTSSDNSAYGYNALNACITGIGNSAFGSGALDVQTGSYNAAFGFNALGAASTSDRNTACGYGALQNVTTGANAYNVGVGYLAGGRITTGKYNTAIGASDLGTGGAVTTNGNTVVGAQCVISPTGTATRVTVLGAYKTATYTGGTDLIVIGANTAADANVSATCSGLALIGANVQPAANNTSNACGIDPATLGAAVTIADNEFLLGNAANLYRYPGAIKAGGAGLRFQEGAAPSDPTAGYGALWVRNDAAQSLMFTDDGNTSHVVLGCYGGLSDYDATFANTVNIAAVSGALYPYAGTSSTAPTSRGVGVTQGAGESTVAFNRDAGDPTLITFIVGQGYVVGDIVFVTGTTTNDDGVYFVLTDDAPNYVNYTLELTLGGGAYNFGAGATGYLTQGDYATVANTGNYCVTWDLSAYAAAARDVEVRLFQNATDLAASHAFANLGTSASTLSRTFNAAATAGDKFTLVLSEPGAGGAQVVSVGAVGVHLSSL